MCIETFADGDYHLTIRAINNIDFGGPMCIKVCHSMPYTVDASPPIIHNITNVDYDEDSCNVHADIITL